MPRERLATSLGACTLFPFLRKIGSRMELGGAWASLTSLRRDYPWGRRPVHISRKRAVPHSHSGKVGGEGRHRYLSQPKGQTLRRKSKTKWRWEASGFSPRALSLLIQPGVVRGGGVGGVKASLRPGSRDCLSLIPGAERELTVFQ